MKNKKVKNKKDGKEAVTKNELNFFVDFLTRRIDAIESKQTDAISNITARLDSLALSMKKFTNLKTWVTGSSAAIGAGIGASVGAPLLDYLKGLF